MNTTIRWRKENGICVECGKNSATDGHIRCRACIDKERSYMKERYKSLKLMNRCPCCGKKKPKGWSMTLCEVCLINGKERRIKWERKKENGKINVCVE